ncbi:ATP-dependent zinc protease family protein [Rhodanobacter lindaniclasticus]
MADPIGARLVILGWRERLALPGLGIAQLKAKLDTGARSSSLHVDTLETFRRGGDVWLRFSLHPGRRQSVVQAEARALDRRMVTDTGGRRTERWFIRSEVQLAGVRFSVDINLTDRRHMLFPLLLGRTALAGRFIVDPSLSYTQPTSWPSTATDVASPA